MTLTEFLLARIVEEEQAANDVLAWPESTGVLKAPSQRRLAECESKRRIVEIHQSYGDYGNWCQTCDLDDPPVGEGWPCKTLRLLALPDADHPEYDQAWRP